MQLIEILSFICFSVFYSSSVHRSVSYIIYALLLNTVSWSVEENRSIVSVFGYIKLQKQQQNQFLHTKSIETHISYNVIYYNQ